MFNTVIRIGLEAFIDLFFSSVLNIKNNNIQKLHG